MFGIGEYVVYGTNGVCEITEITTMNLPDVPSDRKYYVLRPAKIKASVIYAPVENLKTVMRPVITKAEARSLMDSIPLLTELQIPSEKLREDSYKTAYRSGDCLEWVKMVKTLDARKKLRVKQGRKIPATDERYMRMVSEVLFSELAYSLEMDQDSVVQYMEDRLNSQEAGKFSC